MYLVGRDVPETDTRFQATDDVTNTQDFQNVRRYETQFNRVFMAGSAGSQTVINNREFAAFYHLLRCFDDANNTSSSLKVTSLFTSSSLRSSPGMKTILAVSNINSQY